MGKELYCDLCRKSVPLQDNLTEIIIGGTKVCEVCFNCTSLITNDLRATMKDKAMQVLQAQQQAMANSQKVEVEQSITKPTNEIMTPPQDSTGANQHD